MTGVALVPAPVEVLGHGAELDNQVAGEVFRLDFAALLAPQPDQGGLVVAHDDPGVRAADKGAAVRFEIVEISANSWLLSKRCNL